MKRSIILSVAMLAVLVTVTGCSSSNSSVGAAANGTTSSTTATGGRRMPDFGQPKTPADLRGVVTAVVGNQVTLLKIALNAGGRRASSTSPTAASSSNTANTPRISLTGGGTGGGGTRGGGGGFYGGGGGAGGPGGPGGAGGGTNNMATLIASLEAKGTGSETLTIPVGIKMMKSAINPSTQKRAYVEATLNDIVTDSMITVWLNPAAATSSPVANFVLINNQ